VVKEDYTVRLEQVFQGPMDLLLHLVREQEVEIHEIEISRIVDGYLAYLSALEALDIEYAGDFLVMAATLMAIKSRSLLPREELDLEEELDPRDELIQRLLEYRRFKGAAEDLEERHMRRTLLHPRGWRGEARGEGFEREFDMSELTVFDLLTTFSRLMRETMADAPHTIAGDPHPLRFYVDEVVKCLREAGRLDLRTLRDSVQGVAAKDALVGAFCALLELVRMQLIEIGQVTQGGDIEIALRPEHSDDIEEVVRRSIFEGEADEEAETTPEEAIESEPNPFADPPGEES
jgi:segregation and condensation protein A